MQTRLVYHKKLTRVLIPLVTTILLRGQELQPRAYLASPAGMTFASVTYSGNSGGLLFDPSLPVQDSHVSASVASVAVGASLPLFGRSGQVLAVLPYVVADLSGKFAGTQQLRHASGVADATFRYAINLHGAPAMRIRDFAKYRPKTIVGASLTVIAPTGQYDPNRLINLGTNRWAFKPELGVCRFKNKWEFEGAIGAWLYTKNSSFFGSKVRTQDPLGSIQVHVIRLLPHRTWVAFDGTFYTGGRTFVDGTAGTDYQGNTRLGATFAITVTPQQVLKVAYFKGTLTRVGSDISSISVSYQFVRYPRR